MHTAPVPTWFRRLAGRGLTADLRQAIRTLRRSPLFAATSILSLAIGVAAAATIVAVADALLLRPSQGVQADGLVDIARTTNGSGYGPMSYPVFQFLREHTTTLEAMAATTMDPSPLSLGDDSGTTRVFGRTVSAGFFELLGVTPGLGRFFRTDEDAEPGARAVVVLTDRFWREHFDGDPSVIGRQIRLNRAPFTVVGVAPPGFSGVTIVGTDLWVPTAMAGTARGVDDRRLLADPGETWHIAVGRLKPGVERTVAEAELNALHASFQSATPAVPANYGIVVAPSGRLPTPVRARFASFLGLLLAFGAGLLAIACSNVAGMLLMRATTRQREMATRLALGASRLQLVRLMLVETLVLFVAAALVSVPLTQWLLGAFGALLPAFPLPLRLDLVVSGRTIGFAGAAALATGVLFGMAPARQALRTDLAPMLHGRTSTDPRGRLRLRHTLLVGQVALSLLLLTTAGLFLRALQAAAEIDAGFETADVDIVSLDTSVAGVSAERTVAVVNDVVSRVRMVPSVAAVGYARMVPLFSGALALGGVQLPGRTDAELAVFSDTKWDVVSPEYFAALRLPIIDGRPFSPADDAGRPLVAVVNETFAHRAWPGASAVGREFTQQLAATADTPDAGRTLRIIGVAKDAKYQTINERAKAFVYLPFAQQPQTHVEVFVRSAPGVDTARAVRVAIAVAAPDLPVVATQSFDSAVAGGVFPQRLAAWTSGLVGGVGVLLAGLGLYGLVAFMVAQRRHEIAIRIALGAESRRIWRLVLGRTVLLAWTGAALGVGLAFGLGRALQSAGLLMGVSAGDPVTFAVTLIVAAVAIAAACVAPARRAAATNPAGALRGE